MGLEIFIPSKKTSAATASPLDPLVSGAIGATIGVCARGFQNQMAGQHRFHRPHMLALYGVIGFGISLLFDRMRQIGLEGSEKYKDELVLRHRKRLGQSIDLSE